MKHSVALPHPFFVSLSLISSRWNAQFERQPPYTVRFIFKTRSLFFSSAPYTFDLFTLKTKWTFSSSSSSSSSPSSCEKHYYKIANEHKKIENGFSFNSRISFRLKIVCQALHAFCLRTHNVWMVCRSHIVNMADRNDNLYAACGKVYTCVFVTFGNYVICCV